MVKPVKIFSRTESLRRRSAYKVASVSARVRAVDTHGGERSIHDGRSDAPTIATVGAPTKMEIYGNENEGPNGKARPPGSGHAPTN